METTAETAVIETPRVKPPVIPSPRSEGVTGRKPIKIKFHVGKEFLRKFEIPSPDARKNPTTVYHLYPSMSEWIGRQVPDGVNPRSHDPECLKSPVAKKIEQTIFDKPENFYLANRGSTLVAESLDFDPKTGDVEITITDPENQGLADGATTDAVLAKVQTLLAREALEKKDASYTELVNGIRDGKRIDASKLPEILKNGRIHLEVFVGLDDRARIADLVEGRNTSRQVRGWSMADFRGEFDWLKNILEDEKSPFKGKVGYEENSSQDLNILDILSVLTLFHPEYDGRDEMGKEKAPVVAYANKGRMDVRLADEDLRKGYMQLAPITPDILKLWEFIYATFETAYDAAFGAKARLGRREGVVARHDNPIELPLTGLKSNYSIPNGFISPLLAAFRALVVHKSSTTGWKEDPFKFFERHGKMLVGELMEQVEGVGGNPNKAGKNKLVYTALHAKARIALSEDLEEKRNKGK